MTVREILKTIDWNADVEVRIANMGYSITGTASNIAKNCDDVFDLVPVSISSETTIYGKTRMIITVVEEEDVRPCHSGSESYGF